MRAVVVDTVIGNDAVKVHYTVVANYIVMVNDPIVVIDTVNVVIEGERCWGQNVH